jgi:hypothetical protein
VLEVGGRRSLERRHEQRLGVVDQHRDALFPAADHSRDLPLVGQVAERMRIRAARRLDPAGDECLKALAARQA